MNLTGDDQGKRCLWQADEMSVSLVLHLTQLPSLFSEHDTHTKVWFLRNGPTSGIFVFVLTAEPHNLVWRFVFIIDDRDDF